MSFIKNVTKNKAIRAYIVQLPKLLAKDYGKSEFYTPAQVKSTIQREGLPLTYGIYAVAMFCEQDAFYQAMPLSESDRMSNDINYEMIRSEIADNFFDGNIEFTPKHIIAFSPDYLGAGSFGASWRDDVGDFYGGAGGDG